MRRGWWPGVINSHGCSVPSVRALSPGGTPSVDIRGVKGRFFKPQYLHAANTSTMPPLPGVLNTRQGQYYLESHFNAMLILPRNS
jgi:hypothetical protein